MSANAESTDLLAVNGRRVGLAGLFGLSFITALSGAIMPGPLLVVTIEQVSVQGFRAVLGLITGHAFLELIVVVGLVLGLQRFIGRRKVRGVIGLVGGAALVFMGTDMLRNAFGLSLRLNYLAASAYSFPHLVCAGVLVSVANPYFTGWWATIGAGQFAYTAPRTSLEYASFYLGHESGDYLWYAVVGVLMVTGRKWLNDSFFQWLVAGCGGAMLILGILFVITGFRFVRQPQEGVSA